MGYIGAGPTRFNTADELTVTGDAEITGAITTDGMTTTGNVSFGDNDKAIFGAGSDLQIYHDGGQSVIRDFGYGHLRIQAGDLRLENADGTATYLSADNGAALYAYHNGNVKLTTTATGVDVTGSVTADGLRLGDGDYAAFGDGLDLQILHNGAGSYITDAGVGDLHIRADNNLFIQDAAGSTNRVTVNSTGVDVTGTVTTDGLTVDGTGGQITTDNNGFITSKQSLDTITAGGRFIGKSNRGELGQIAIEQTATGADGGYIRFSTSPSGSTAPAERMRIDSSGNVGIGQSNPTSPNGATDFLHIGNSSNQDTSIVLQDAVEIWEIYNNDDLLFNFDTTNVMTLQRVTGNVGIGTSPSELLHIRNASGDAAVRIQGNTRTFNIEQNNYGLRFVDVDAGSAERMRVTAAGDVLIGTQTKETTGTTLYGSTANGFYIKTTSTCGYLITQAGVGGAGFFISLYSDTTAVGSITTNGSSTTYGTTSDYRLKENVTADWDATTRLKQLNPVRFNFISDADTTVDGFLAHEVQDIVPEAIVGEKDGMRDEEYEVTPAVLDDDGNEVTPAVMGTRSVPDYQGIDQSKLVPLLVKTIQELEARIVALESK